MEKCLKIEYTFDGDRCEDFGSDCGCESCEELSDDGYNNGYDTIIEETGDEEIPEIIYKIRNGKKHEQESWEGVSCVKIEENQDIEKYIENYKNKIERYKRFQSPFNFVGRGSTGHITVISIEIVDNIYGIKLQDTFELENKCIIW